MRFNSSPTSAAYMRQWIGSSLVQLISCRPFGTKPLPEPRLVYRQLDIREQVSKKLESEFYHFLSRKCIWKCFLLLWGDELKSKSYTCGTCLNLIKSSLGPYHTWLSANLFNRARWHFDVHINEINSLDFKWVSLWSLLPWNYFIVVHLCFKEGVWIKTTLSNSFRHTDKGVSTW